MWDSTSVAFVAYREVCFECLDIVNCIDGWGFLSMVLNILIPWYWRK